MNTGRRNPIEGPTEFDPGTQVELGDDSAASTSTGFRVYVLVTDGQTTRAVDVADGEALLFGRAPEAQIRIDDTRASRKHAELRRTGRDLVVVDSGAATAPRSTRSACGASRRRSSAVTSSGWATSKPSSRPRRRAAPGRRAAGSIASSRASRRPALAQCSVASWWISSGIRQGSAL